jgi:hypothetical protein
VPALALALLSQLLAVAKAPSVELLNQQVQFRVCDIYFPDPQIVMKELYGESVLEGRVLEITENDGGARFALVEVSKLHTPVLIGVEHIKRGCR